MTSARQLPGIVLASATLAASSAALPVPAAAEAVAADRPRIGLVLGGGGARGGAHIGVLQVLEDLRIPVDCIAGTSMGALVGATYAAGADAGEITELVSGIDWSATLGTAGQRAQLPMQRKLAGITYSNNLQFMVSRGRLRPDPGLLATQNVEQLLRLLIADARAIDDFDALPIPFRAVATDLVAGEVVVLDSGDLSVAMRASMAVPGAFAPVTRGEQVLADGGLLRNLPVGVARGLCADVVIAVLLEQPAGDPAALGSLLALAGASLDAMIRANELAQLETLGEADIVIRVLTGDIGPAQFERVPETIPLGEAAAREQQAALARLSLPESDYRAWREAVGRGPTAEVELSAIRFLSLERANEEWLRSRLRMKPGERVPLAVIEAEMGRLFSSADFSRVDYRLIDADPPGSRILEIDAVERPGSQNFVRFDGGIAASSGGDVLFTLSADHRREWLNPRGGQWRNAIQLGQESEIATFLYQPLDVAQVFYVEPGLRLTRSFEDVFDDGDRIARYDLRQAGALLDAGINIGDALRLRTGLRWGHASAGINIGDSALPETRRSREAAWTLGAVLDTRDTAFLPTSGTFAQLEYISSGSGLGGEQRYSAVDAVIGHAIPWQGHVLQLAAGAGGKLGGELPPWRQFQLGGVRSFPALERGELRGEGYWSGSATWLQRVADIQTVFGQVLYGGISLQAARVSGRIDGVREGSVYGGALFLGGRTPVGPLRLSLGIASQDNVMLHLALGRPVSESSLLDKLW